MQNRYSSRPWRALCALMCAVFLLAGSGLSRADDDHELARKAMEAGEVLSLRTILEIVDRDYPGQVFDVELERDKKHGPARWVYEIKILRTGGALVKLKVDARDGRLISRKSKDEHDGDKMRQINSPNRDGR